MSSRSHMLKTRSCLAESTFFLCNKVFLGRIPGFRFLFHTGVLRVRFHISRLVAGDDA